jgi:hypothetical protein
MKKIILLSTLALLAVVFKEEIITPMPTEVYQKIK